MIPSVGGARPLVGFLNAAAREPFRLFFPLATLAGIIGVALWPLHLLGISATYPGQFHARIMTHGLFGGFIFGFLGTAMPRMLSAPPLRKFEMLPLLLVHFAMVAFYAVGNIPVGNGLFLLLLLGFAAAMAPRVRHRKDLPPPGFILVGLSMACAASGAVLGVFNGPDTDLAWQALEKLLTYQGFVLLPILGIGPFILPRFFGLQSSHDFPESLAPSSNWLRKALLAASVGLAIVGTFFIEAKGEYRIAYAVRFVVTLGYMLLEMPLKRAPSETNVFGAAIRISLVGIVSGFLAIALFPAYRVGLLHVTLVGGFAVITFVVATRVLFGHSGNLGQLKGRNWWFLIAIGIMLFATLTRISGDFWPKIMATHYIYGAILWIAGVVLWAVYALRKIVVIDEE